MKKIYTAPNCKLILVSPEICRMALSTSDAYQTTIDVDTKTKDGEEVLDHWIGGDLDISKDGALNGWEFAKPETWFEED